MKERIVNSNKNKTLSIPISLLRYFETPFVIASSFFRPNYLACSHGFHLSIPFFNKKKEVQTAIVSAGPSKHQVA